MGKEKETGVYQLANGNWGFRYGIVVDGSTVWKKSTKDDTGNALKTQAAAARARKKSMQKTQSTNNDKEKPLTKKTVAAVYKEYCENGRAGKAFTTIRKQDSLWENHIRDRFSSRIVSEITTAEIQDYLTELYYIDGRAYSYVESFLKMFYLIFGQAYSRDYLGVEQYNKLCKNKDTKIHMPKMKVDEETDIVIFDDKQIQQLDDYFRDTNAETAYMLGKHCGLRINECYGLKWDKINWEEGTIMIDRQMQYQNGLIKLVPLKTRNARRKVYMSDTLRRYMEKCYQQRMLCEENLSLQRKQNQTMIQDSDGEMISSLELINTLDNGKIQTVNSMKYHATKIKAKCEIYFKYHYLRHTYGTILATANTPVHILCNQMGHGNSNVTQKYYIGTSLAGVEVLRKNLNMAF